MVGTTGTTPEMKLNEAVAAYSIVVGEEFSLVGPMPGGETGATEILRHDGAHFVLKWDHDPGSKERRRDSVAVARRLGTEAGWPVPAIEIAEDKDWLFVRQEFMAGASIHYLTHRHVDQLLALIEQSRGLAKPGNSRPTVRRPATQDWPDELLWTLTNGGNGYCNHEPLRQYSTRSRQLVERVGQIGGEFEANLLLVAKLGGSDLIHWDLHPGNILQLDGSVSAIIDLDHARVGDRGFDLATLELTSMVTECEPGVRSRLRGVVRRNVGLELRLASHAHLLLRMVDWDIRKQRTGMATFWLDRWPELLED